MYLNLGLSLGGGTGVLAQITAIVQPIAQALIVGDTLNSITNYATLDDTSNYVPLDGRTIDTVEWLVNGTDRPGTYAVVFGDSVVLRVTDSEGDTFTRTIDGNVLYPAPTVELQNIDLDIFSSAAVGTKIADIASTGSPALSVIGDDAVSFQISGVELQTASTLAAGSYEVGVRATGDDANSSGQVDTALITVVVTVQAPTVSLTPTSATISNGTLAGSTVATITLGGGPAVPTLSGADAALFQISGTNLQLASDATTDGTFNVTVNVSNLGGSNSAAFALTVSTLQLTGFSITDNDGATADTASLTSSVAGTAYAGIFPSGTTPSSVNPAQLIAGTAAGQIGAAYTLGTLAAGGDNLTNVSISPTGLTGGTTYTVVVVVDINDGGTYTNLVGDEFTENVLGGDSPSLITATPVVAASAVVPIDLSSATDGATVYFLIGVDLNNYGVITSVTFNGNATTLVQAATPNQRVGVGIVRYAKQAGDGSANLVITSSTGVQNAAVMAVQLDGWASESSNSIAAGAGAAGSISTTIDTADPGAALIVAMDRGGGGADSVSITSGPAGVTRVGLATLSSNRDAIFLVGDTSAAVTGQTVTATASGTPDMALAAVAVA